MGRKITLEFVKSEFQNRNYDLLEEKFISARTKMRYVCKTHSEIVQEIKWANFQQGRGCRFCGHQNTKNKQKLEIEYVKKEFQKRGLILLEEIYINNNTPMRYECPKHPDKVLYKTWINFKKGSGCPHCVGLARLTIDFIRDEFLKRGYKILDKDYVNSSSKIKFECAKHPEKSLSITWDSFKQGQGCKYCGFEKLANDRKFDYNFVKTEFNKKGYVLLETEYINANTPMKYKCPRHPKADLFKTFSSLQLGTNCPLCNESKGENKIRQWLEYKEILYIHQKRFDGLVGIGGGSLSYDFYLPKENILIEYQGEFHDGNGNYYMRKNLNRQKRHDQIKRSYAIKNGFNLKEIWYWDYDNIESILENFLV